MMLFPLSLTLHVANFHLPKPITSFRTLINSFLVVDGLAHYLGHATVHHNQAAVAKLRESIVIEEQALARCSMSVQGSGLLAFSPHENVHSPF